MSLQLPGERVLRTERQAFLRTLESLSDEEFESGRTLCAGWAPRDVLAHLVGVDREPMAYVTALGRVGAANERVVEASRGVSRAELMAKGRRWAESPAPHARLGAFFLLGDVAVHHQDVLRGLGRQREVPRPVAAAVLREGMTLGAPKLLRHRVVPTDGGRPIGRGQQVRGKTEALGMWLAGRSEVAAELEFR